MQPTAYKVVKASQSKKKERFTLAIQVIREVSADVVKRGSTRAVYAKQDDFNSRFLNVLIQEDGKDIKVNPEAEVILNVERPDKLKNMFYGTINEDGSVKVPLTSWMLELEGTLSCDISIVKEGVAKLTTMQFNIYVEEAVVSDSSIIETEDYSVIVDLLKRTTESAQIASKAAENATTLKNNCEAATNKANKAANEANKVKEEVAAGGFIEAIKEQNRGVNLKFWIGSQAEYDVLPSKLANCFYIITDDNIKNDLVNAVTRQNKVLWEGNLLCDFELSSSAPAPNAHEYDLFAIEMDYVDPVNPGAIHLATALCYKTSHGDLNGVARHLGWEWDIHLEVFTNWVEVFNMQAKRISDGATQTAILKRIIGIM